ncbi:MAG: DedA family protein [Candidatus Spechtbacterales bacterium]
MEFILEWLSSFIISAIENTGYAGIAFLMALESANIPVPSEIIMPFSGYLVFQGKLNLLQVVFWGALGNLAGSILSYYLGYFGGRRVLEKYGKFLFISGSDIDLADRWFQKYGTIIVFASRMLPIARTFISFPAGIARMNVFKFSAYTFTGSLIWSYFLTYAGVIMGENWTRLEVYFRKFDWAIAALIVMGAGWWVWRHIKIHNSP